jgi:flagellin
MTSVINTNSASITARNALRINSRDMNNAMTQLSTGKRINTAIDDAAGSSISEGMTAQIRGLSMAVRNANDGISLAQTTEGAAGQITNMMQRMRELAVQASTATVSTDQRTYLNTEYQALKNQIKQTITETTWNGMSLLTSGAAANPDIEFEIQVGADATDGSGSQQVTVASKNILNTRSLAASSELTDAAKATSAITALDDDITAMNGLRSDLGSVVSRLNSVTDNLSNRIQNISDSRSRIRDADYAQVTAELTRTQIIQQAGMAVLAQANQQPQSVLSLLK